MRTGRLGFALGAALWSYSALAWAHDPRVALELTRGEGTEACLREHALERAVERRLRRPVFAEPGSADLHIAVAFVREEAGAWTAKLALRGRNGAELGARELETHAPNCSALDDSLVLVVALLVDSPEARAGALAAAPSTETKPNTPSPSVAPSPGAVPERSARGRTLELPSDTFAPREPFRIEVGADAAVSAGAIPGLAAGAALSLAVRPPHLFEFRLRPTFFFPGEVHAPTADRGGRFSLLAVDLDVCPLETEFGPVRLSSCAGQRVGRLAAEGFGFRKGKRSAEVYYALGASAGAAFWLAPPFGVALELGAEAPLTRDAYFSLGTNGERRSIFVASPVVGVATAGIVLALR